MTFFLCAQKCIFQCIFVPHIFTYLVRQYLNLVVAVVQLTLCDGNLFFQLIQKFINIFLLLNILL